MTSSTSGNLRRQDPLQNPLPYGTYYSQDNFWDRISQPGFLVPLLLLAAAGYQLVHNQAASRNRQLPTIGEILWDTIVFVTPAFLLYGIDRWVNPALSPTPMLQTQPTTHAAKSDALRRILRADQPGGIVASVSQAGRRTLTNTFSGFKGGSSQPAGLGNWDNSCYQNSILQGLASLRLLPRYLTGATPAEPPPDDDQTTTAGALRAFIAELNDASNNGKTLFTPGLLKNMSTIQQQDAQEYFSKLMEQVDKDIEKGARTAYKTPGFEADLAKDDAAASQHSDDSGYQSLPMLSKAGSELITIRNPLEGLSAQRVACTACGYSEGLSMIPFNCLTLNFEVGVSHYDLFELLDNFVRLETIERVDCVKCTILEYRKNLQQMGKAIPAVAARLEAIEMLLEEEEFDDKGLKKLKIPDSKKVSSTKTKQAVIGRPPPSLVMHMNRSVFDPMTFRSYKNLAAVQFPMTLDLGPWCIGSAEAPPAPVEAKVNGAGPQLTGPAPDKEQWVLDATASMVAGDAHPSKISGPIYELRAVVTHYGRHENGHYVCYRRHPRGAVKVSEGLEAEEEVDQPPNLAGDQVADDVDSVHDDSVHDDSVHDDSRLDKVATVVDAEEFYDHETDSQWWRLSDETITKVTEHDVLSQGGVFMLFYDCVDSNSVLISHGEAAEAEAEAEAADPVETPLTVVEDSGRKSPSWSDDSVATLCNPSMEGEGESEPPSVTSISQASSTVLPVAGHEQIPLPEQADNSEADVTNISQASSATMPEAEAISTNVSQANPTTGLVTDQNNPPPPTEDKAAQDNSLTMEAEKMAV